MIVRKRSYGGGSPHAPIVTVMILIGLLAIAAALLSGCVGSGRFAPPDYSPDAYKKIKP